MPHKGPRASSFLGSAGGRLWAQEGAWSRVHGQADGSASSWRWPSPKCGCRRCLSQAPGGGTPEGRWRGCSCPGSSVEARRPCAAGLGLPASGSCPGHSGLLAPCWMGDDFSRPVTGLVPARAPRVKVALPASPSPTARGSTSPDPVPLLGAAWRAPWLRVCLWFREGSRDRVPYRASCREPASPSASLCLSRM